MFIDKVEITVKAGNGGDGHKSFYRDVLTMFGGPDGGDGGKGGDVIFVGTSREDNLIEFRFVKKFAAADGERGASGNKAGKNGADLRIPVPLGTRILNAKTEVIADITQDGQEFRALHGGAGGKGNAGFATSRKQTPNFSKTGVKTREYKVTLELRCIADVGLVGFPNVGKSTILSIISRANPKIANYHFTTLYPNLGVVSGSWGNFIVADIPGLIEGASQGAGLGHDFLRHIDRTRLLVHVVDISGYEGRDPVDDFKKINAELANYSATLAKRPQIIALNKADIDDSRVAEFKKAVKGHKIFVISSATRRGIDELLAAVAGELAKLPRVQPQITFAELEQKSDPSRFEIQVFENKFVVTGQFVENLIRGVVLSDTESNAYFQRRLVESGVVAAMREKGLKDGDTVCVADAEFEWVE
jgi:GTP-binding protein